MRRVCPATPYRPGALSSLGNASNMLIRQYQFPDTYSEEEKLVHADHDRLLQNDHDRTRQCFLRHARIKGDFGFEGWIGKASDDQIIKFLVDVLKADVALKWTGYRIMGSVHRGNGGTVWSLALFSKDPNGDTKVYTGENAPNVRPKS